ncbi:MAG: hypothetical protein AABN34_27855 [Acidobacteriota bacterium]
MLLWRMPGSNADASLADRAIGSESAIGPARTPDRRTAATATAERTARVAAVKVSPHKLVGYVGDSVTFVGIGIRQRRISRSTALSSPGNLHIPIS